MMEFIENNFLWFIGVLFAFISFIQTWRIYSLTNRKRSIEIGYNNKWSFSTDSMPYEVQAIFNKNTYSKLLYFKCFIRNTSDTLILKEDISGSILICSTNRIKILDYEIDEDNTFDSKYEFLPKTDSNGLELFEFRFDRLPTNKVVKFNFICEQLEEVPEIILKFNFTNQTKQDKIYSYNSSFDENRHYSSALEGVGLILILLYLASYYFSFILVQKYSYKLIRNVLGFARESSEIISFFLGIFPSIVIFSTTLYFIWKWWRKRKSRKD